MATVNKDFRVKHGLVVEGTTGTINGEDILTTGNTTDDLTQGSTNLYFSDELAQDAINTAIAAGSHDGITITYDDNAGSFSFTVTDGVGDSTTDDLVEGSTNLYFTTTRARESVSGGNGITYNSGTGEISIDDTVVVTESDLDAHTNASSGVHGVTGNVVGTTDSQTISNKTLGSNLIADGNKITGLGTPTASGDAATKGYVDTVAEGLSVKPAVLAATSTNLSATYDNGTNGVDSTLNLGPLATLDIDGVTSWSVGDGILVKDQTNGFENGRYYVDQVGDAVTDWILNRCPACDEPDEIPSSYVFVQNGTTYNATGWVAEVENPATFAVGTDAITWVQFSGAGTYTAGNGLTLTGSEFTIDTSVTADLNSSQTITNKTIDGGDNTLQNIPNTALTNDSITVNGTSTSLGGSVTLDADDIDDTSTTNKFFTDELAVDAVAAAIDAGTHTNITITYDDEAGTISFNSAGASIIDTDVSFTSVEINSVSKQVAATQTVTTAGQAIAHSFAHAEYTSAEYFVKVDTGTHTEVSKLLLTLDSSNNIAITEYGIVNTSGTALGTVSAGINGNDVELLVTTANDNSDVTVTGTLLV